MYGCFWCSVQGHLIKGECTPVTGGQCQPVGYFPSEQVTIRKPRRSHACMALLVHSNWQCVCACVYLRKLQLSKTHFVSSAAHFMSWYKYALKYLQEKICKFPNTFCSLHKLNKYWFVCFPLPFCGQSVTPFSLRGWGFIASQWLNPLNALWSLSHRCFWWFNEFKCITYDHILTSSCQMFNRDEPEREKRVYVTVKASDMGRSVSSASTMSPLERACQFCHQDVLVIGNTICSEVNWSIINNCNYIIHIYM